MSRGAAGAAPAANEGALPGAAPAPSTWPAPAAFDRIAERYDETFTDTMVGRLQRGVVWEALSAAFAKGERVLEMNCGTGEDAVFLARRGVRVTACDGSAGMIAAARRRKLREEAGGNVEFRTLANENLGELRGEPLFDGAFSNFSGLNCTKDLSEIAASVGGLLRPGARLVICVYARTCAWEVLSYLSRGDVRKAFRRTPGHAIARVEGAPVQVWYPTLRQIRKQLAPWFRMRSVRAVGLFVPPSYAEAWARRHPRGVAAFAKLDARLGRLPILRVVGDHMLAEFERNRA